MRVRRIVDADVTLHTQTWHAGCMALRLCEGERSPSAAHASSRMRGAKI